MFIHPQEASLGRKIRCFFPIALFALLIPVCTAQTTPVTLETSETLFTVLAAMNACGYDADLNVSDPLRTEIRGEVAKAIQEGEAKETAQEMCQFYRDHQQADPSRDLSQYVSLALYLNPPPALTPKIREADLPPDAANVLGFLPILQKFYTQASLQQIWQRHRAEYSLLTQGYHEALAKMTFDTEVYLKLQSAGYLGSNFTIYMEPMAAPSQTNARIYASDYYVVIAPGKDLSLKMEQIRHTYLHYLLDPLAIKYPTAVNAVRPLLETVKSAPMENSFKGDPSLLVTECLIRAVEARTLGSKKTPEAEREQAVENSVEQGFILTRYFYEALVRFEKDPAGLRDAYREMLSGINIVKEQKRAAEVHFAAKADSELLRLAPPKEKNLLLTAEQKLSAGDMDSAQKLAQQALDQKSGDAGQAFFILARIAIASSNIAGAGNYFQRALESAHEPRIVAWSHIYLGRISDLQENRELALSHYRLALNAGGALPGVKAAAERGLQQPYEPPHHPQE